MSAAGPGRGEFGAEGNHQQGAQIGQSIDQPGEHVKRRGVDPMRVLQQREHRVVPGQPFEHREQRGDRALLLLRRGHFQRRVSPLAGDRQQSGDKRRDVLRLQSRTRDHRLELVEPGRRRLADHKTRRMPDLARDRMEGVVDVVRRALITDPHMRLVADPLAERRQNARLANARLARDERDLTFALARLPPAVEEQGHLMLAPYERRQALGPRRLEAADVLRLAKNRPGGNRRVEAF